MSLYPDYPKSSVALEQELLERWREEELFQKTLQVSAGGQEFVFFEGPPTANGRPGIHHVFARTIKDLVCRYRTACGYHITRIAGWDTHGLPVEIEAEKKLGISGKREIEEVGVERFNQVCRDSVFIYKQEWERFSERLGYWLDYSDPYVTFHSEYVESVWWLLKQIAKKGLLYRGHKSVPYCPRCGTALSSHEVAQGYEDILDPSIYFVAPIVDDEGREDPERRAFLVWTTTPWTLPSNVALAVHPDLPYGEIEHDGRRLILEESRLQALFGAETPVRRWYRGAELVGTRYRRPFDILPAPGDAGKAAWTVLPADFVTSKDGTGIVHQAPAYGADDFAMGQKYGLPMFQPIDDAGKFKPEIPIAGGLFFKAADDPLAHDLTARGLVFRYGMEAHTYPHCWRCASPLIYMARETWYIRTTAVKDQMLRNNALVDWHPPEMGAGRFGEWLEGNIDWALSRDRYWGTPLPVWLCDRDPSHMTVIESFRELEVKAGQLPQPFDPHKPYIDAITWPCSEEHDGTPCGGTMRRTPETIDAWFDSGAMPYAQWHFPFEHREEWRSHFPADFICEGVDQTRGWFYSLMAIATLMDDGPPYKAVIVNELILDAEGQKMSKSRGNAVDPITVMAEFGADALRWYLVTVSQPWVPKRFDAAALADAARRVFDTLANTYRFFALYANLEEWRPGEVREAGTRSVLDRWVRSRLAGLTAQVRAGLDAYDVTPPMRAVGEFIVDDLSNWYVRRSRDRFWGSADSADAQAAFATLHEVLVDTARLLAPVTPFQTDWLHRSLTGASVHLAPFPELEPGVRDERLERGMAAVRVLSRLGRAARERVKIRVRQPLRTLFAVLPRREELSGELLDIVRDELNVKDIRFLAAAEELVTLRANPNFKTLGPRFGKATQQAADAIRALPSSAVAAFRRGEQVSIEVGGERHVLALDHLSVVEEARGNLIVESDLGYTVALDPAVDEALRLEGVARELVSRVQRLRKDAGLAVSDRVRLGIFGPAEVQAATGAHGDTIRRETLAVGLEIGDAAHGDGYEHTADVDLDGIPVRIALSRMHS